MNHVANLIIDKCNLLCNALDQEFELKSQVLAIENSVIVFFDIRCFTFSLCHSDGV